MFSVVFSQPDITRSVGHFDYSGDLDTCIAIRTMLFKDGIAYLQGKKKRHRALGRFQILITPSISGWRHCARLCGRGRISGDDEQDGIQPHRHSTMRAKDLRGTAGCVSTSLLSTDKRRRKKMILLRYIQ